MEAEEFMREHNGEQYADDRLVFNHPHLKIHKGHEENLRLMKETCSLNVADWLYAHNAQMQQKDIGSLLGIDIERVRQIEAGGLQKMNIAERRSRMELRPRKTAAQKQQIREDVLKRQKEASK